MKKLLFATCAIALSFGLVQCDLSEIIKKKLGTMSLTVDGSTFAAATCLTAGFNGTAGTKTAQITGVFANKDAARTVLINLVDSTGNQVRSYDVAKIGNFVTYTVGTTAFASKAGSGNVGSGSISITAIDTTTKEITGSYDLVLREVKNDSVQTGTKNIKGSFVSKIQ
jgi:hypothetical protein